MLQAANMLKDIEESINSDLKYDNNDFDLGEVLDFCHTEDSVPHTYKCLNGQERSFTFNE